MNRRATVIVAAAIMGLTGACAQLAAQQNDDSEKTDILADLIPTAKPQNNDGQKGGGQNDGSEKTGIFDDLIPTTGPQNAAGQKNDGQPADGQIADSQTASQTADGQADDGRTIEQIGRFQIIAGAGTSIWVLDTGTGAVRFCTPVLNAPSGAPVCSAWGGDARE